MLPLDAVPFVSDDDFVSNGIVFSVVGSTVLSETIKYQYFSEYYKQSR